MKKTTLERFADRKLDSISSLLTVPAPIHFGPDELKGSPFVSLDITFNTELGERIEFPIPLALFSETLRLTDSFAALFPENEVAGMSIQFIRHGLIRGGLVSADDSAGCADHETE